MTRPRRYLRGRPRSPREILTQLAEEALPEEDADFYGAGASIGNFEAEIAAQLGKEAAVFMPSGTMAQQIALRIACMRRGDSRIALHATSHLELHEHRAYRALQNLISIPLGDPKRTLSPLDFETLTEPVAAALVELPMREIGGTLPSWDELSRIAVWARAHRVHLHLDGARLWECGPAYDRPYSEICSHFDSVYVSFYKGLGGIAGAILAGDADLIADARIWQRRMGGNLKTLFPYVLSARRSQRERIHRFAAYARHCAEIAGKLEAIDGITLTPREPLAGMMHVHLRGDRERLEAAAAAIALETGDELFKKLGPSWLLDGHGFFELSVGDAALEFSADEVRERFADLMSR